MSRLWIKLRKPCGKCGGTNRVSITSILGRHHRCRDCHDVIEVKTNEQILNDCAQRAEAKP